MLNLNAVATDGHEAVFPDLFDARSWCPEAGANIEIDIRRTNDIHATIVSKRRPGFTSGEIDALRSIVRDLSHAGEGPSRFLVLDLAGGKGGTVTGGDFGRLLTDLSDLVIKAPVVPIGWARGPIAGPDLELALACSVIAGEPEATFSFDLDLVNSLRSYATLAHKVGFVRAERLLESGAEIDVAQMSQLMLLTPVPPSQGNDGIQDFARSRARRHNAACGIYRAQRLAMPRL